MNELLMIQKALKCPKELYSSFGEFYYRDLESILEAVKPLLSEHGLFLILDDSVEHVGEKNYIIATATLYFKDGSKISCKGVAAEDEGHKKMSQAQISGASSSYARKRALSGLFLLDDVKDTDGTPKETTDSIAFEKYEQPTKGQLCELEKIIKHYKGLKKWGLVERLEETKRANRDYIQKQIDNFNAIHAGV